MPAADVRARSTGADWAMTGLLIAGLAVALAALSSILTDVTWWLVAVFEACVVLIPAAIVRTIARRRFWGTVAAAVAAVMSMTLLFAPGTALLGVIPTVGSLEAFRALEVAGSASIAGQGIPADADAGIVYLLCLGVAAFAVVMDALAFVARTPTLTGVPMLVLLLVPSIVEPSFDDGFFFVLAAAVYVGILLVRGRREARLPALGFASVAIIAALVVPLALPPVESPGGSAPPPGDVATGLNPILTLGNDLRRGNPTLALTYTTSASAGVYLRLTTLDDFTGESWQPAAVEFDEANEVEAIGAPAGLTDAVPRTVDTTEVTIGTITSRWLPAPYAPTRVDGLEGRWAWEPDGLAIRSVRGTIRDQQYTVESLSIAPSIEQLTAAGTAVEPGFDRYLVVPDDLPEVVGDVAAQVTAGAATNYDKALALQSYFTNGDFTYSEEAPVDEGYDGSGASVLDDFLLAKAGYCVHFSSAMASMARTLGIPARVAVGFTPGEPSDADDGGVEFRVTTHQLHAWPELYFVGIGWVRFEPTPGRGAIPEFAPLAADDPATPAVDESVPVPPPAPTTSPAATPAPGDPIEVGPTGGPESLGEPPSARPGIPWAALVVLGVIALALVPFALRTITRARRLRRTGEGSAAAGWEEIADTALDLGVPATDTLTPRQFARELGASLDPGGRDALARLLVGLEIQSYANRPANSDPDDVRVVLRSLRRSAGIPRTLLATVAPRSVFAGLLPTPVSPPG